MAQVKIACPKCNWEPDGQPYWMCDTCGTVWDTFATTGICPGCRKQFEQTQCIPHAGGCDRLSPHLDWYRGLDNWVREQLATVVVRQPVAIPEK